MKYTFSLKSALLLVLVLTLPFNTWAWGLLGHRVVGGIAEKYLNSRTKTEIRKILGNESIAMASNWGDFIRSDRAYDYMGPWHYINLPSGMTYERVEDYLSKDTATDIYTRMKFLVRELKNRNLSGEKKVFYLKLLIHFAGDLHQPMHAGRPEDKGGNSIRLYWFNTPTNLHRIWDEQLIEFQQLSYTEYIEAINFAGSSQVKSWQRQPMKEWVWESYQIAEKIYGGIKKDDRLGYAYNYQYLDIMNGQLLKGGVRLAALLNEIYSGT